MPFTTEGTYWSGVQGAVTFTPDATSVEILTINNTGWAAEETNRVSEVTNAQSGGHAKYIASVDDDSGSFDVVWNSVAPPASVGLAKGKTGSLKQYLGASGKLKTQNIIVEKVAHKVDCQKGAIMYTVNWKGNGPVVDS